MGIFTKVSHKYAKVTRLFIAKVTQLEIRIRKFAKKKSRLFAMVTRNLRKQKCSIGFCRQWNDTNLHL